MFCSLKHASSACLFLSILSGQSITGTSSAATAGLDTVMQGLLTKYSIPGAALAVSRNGSLVYARGFGYANTANSTPVQPDSLFRIGSVSKTFTAVAILELVQQGKLQLSQSAFGLLPNLTPVSGATVKPQLASVTVQELLNMTGGWDRSIVPDAVDNTLVIANATGFANPLSCPEVIQYQLGQPLQHAPGSTYAYSNFGYCVLGAIIEQVGGMDYVDFVRQNVLTPLGIQRAKQAEPFLSDTVNGEVTYYDYPGAPLAKNVYNPTGPLVPAPYGNHDFLDSEASGAWITTPIELLRFVNGVDGVRGGPLLQPVLYRRWKPRRRRSEPRRDFTGSASICTRSPEADSTGTRTEGCRERRPIFIGAQMDCALRWSSTPLRRARWKKAPPTPSNPTM